MSMISVIPYKSHTYLDVLRNIKFRQNYVGDFERDEEVSGIFFSICQYRIT